MARQHHHIGIQLRRHRSLMGYSIREAARTAGVAPNRLSEWERGVRTPTVESLTRLAVAYRVLLDELCRDLRKKAIAELQQRIEYPIETDKPP